MQNQGQQFTNGTRTGAVSAGTTPMNSAPMGVAPMMMKNTPAGAIAAKIEAASNILVALSKDPSVDEISAALGLAMMLDSMGKHVTAIYSGRTPNALKFLKPEKTFETNANSLQDFIIALNKDKADHLRYKVDGDFVKIYITPYRAKITEKDLEFSHGDFNVDLIVAVDVKDDDDLDRALVEHGRIMHDAGTVNISIEKPGTFGEIRWCDTNASAVCELVAKMVDYFQKRPTLTPEVATAFLTGIVANTDRFMNEKTTPEVMGVASKLMAAGANQVLISQNMAKTEPGLGKKMEEELEKPLESKKEKVDSEKSEEAKELDELAALAVSAAEESAEKMPGKVPDTEPRLEIKEEEVGDSEEKVEEPDEKAEGSEEKVEEPVEDGKKLLDEESFEKEMDERREAATGFGEGIPDAPKEHEVPGSENVNLDSEEDGKLLERDPGEEKSDEAEEKPEKSDEEALEEALEHIGESNKPVDVTEELKEMAGEVESKEKVELKDSEEIDLKDDSKEKPRMGAVSLKELETDVPKMDASKELDEDSPKDRPDTTGARNVRDLEKMKNGIVLTEEMTAEDVLGQDSAAASEKVLEADIYPDIHKIPENVEKITPKPKDYGAMMEEALTEQTQTLADSPIAAAPVGQSMPTLQDVAQGISQGGFKGQAGGAQNGFQGMMNPAAQMAPQVMNQPETNHIPTMEYIPDGSIQNEVPAQMNGNYLMTPMMPAQGVPQAQPVQPMQQMTPQQMAMQVMSQMAPTQQGTPVMTPMSPAPMQQGMPMNSTQGAPEVSLPVAPAPPIDFMQMMPPTQGNAQPQQNAVTAGQLAQQNDPSAFHIPGM